MADHPKCKIGQRSKLYGVVHICKDVVATEIGHKAVCGEDEVGGLSIRFK